MASVKGFSFVYGILHSDWRGELNFYLPVSMISSPKMLKIDISLIFA